MTNAGSSARMFASSVATLGCAFLLLSAAATGVVTAITREANDLERQRQHDRIEAALQDQIRLGELRLERLAVAGDLHRAARGADPRTSLQLALDRLRPQLGDFDGAFLVGVDGLPVAGVDADGEAAPGAGSVLRRFGAPPSTQVPHYTDWGFGHSVFGRDGDGTVLLTTLDLSKNAGPAAGHLAERTFLLVYRRLTAQALSELVGGYKVADLRLTGAAPHDALTGLAVPMLDPASPAWLAWSPARPGDAMLERFLWALIAVAALFSAIFVFIVLRLRAAAVQIALREQEIQKLAAQDELSLLPNRRSFDLSFDQALEAQRASATPLAVMLIDLDRFKAVNDTYGHIAGDELIRQVAGRLSLLMRPGDIVARFGGDEFGVIQSPSATPADCAALGQRILGSLTEPFQVQGSEVAIGCSIGIAIAPRDGGDRETLLRCADTALYQAKHSGRNRHCLFEPLMNRSLQLKRMVEDDLRNAIERDELTLHYQPQVSIDGATIVGVEALVRWAHPEHGMVPPSEFIAVAEECGLIVPLSEWVLRRACLEAARWPGLRLAVNVSPIQFRHRDFVANVIRIIEEAGFDPARLELELTEGVLIDDADAAETAMMDIRAHGVGLALDDFGTGYSSLIYLRRFAFDKIKIDRTFLEYMEATGESAILVHSMAHLGRALGLRVCAEGVETAEQHRFLQAIGCHELQGFFFSRPVPAAEIDRLLGIENPFAGILAAA